MNLQNVNHLVHAYKVAPWRIQRQWIGSAFVLVVVLAMVATLYLDVTSKAAIAGREIQDLTVAINSSRQTSADLQTEYAALTSTAVMRQRAPGMFSRLGRCMSPDASTTERQAICCRPLRASVVTRKPSRVR